MATPEDPRIDSLEGGDTPHHLRLTVGERSYDLTWENTLVRKFLVGDGAYDHVLHLSGEGKEKETFYLFLTEQAAFIREFLEENDYPYRVDPVLDKYTADIYAEGQAMNLDEELRRELADT